MGREIDCFGRTSRVLSEIAEERRRQVEEEGWTPDHDDCHVDGELGEAAAAYAAIHDGADTLWPFSDEWFKRTTRRRDLIKAGALIVAEIERLDRFEARGQEGEPKERMWS